MSDSAVVLIIEENSAVRDALREQLNDSCRILEVPRLRGCQSVPEEAAPSPDLILSDLRGAEGQALTLYRRLEADPVLDAVPVLLLVPPAGDDDPPENGEETRPVLPGAMGPQALRRLVGHHLAAEGLVPGPPVVPGAPLPETVEAIVETRLGDPDFTVGELAETVGLSRRQLTRRMKDAFGATPAAYVRARRLDRAEKLLAAGPSTIAAVAEAVGFASPSAFSKAFREHVGTAPSDYAEQNAE